MAKNKPTGRPTPPRRLADGTRKAYELLESGKATEALEMLVELDRAYPNTPEVLRNLAIACYDLNDLLQYEQVIRRMSRLIPHNAEITYSLAVAYTLNSRPALAIRTFQDALRRWPEHPKAELARREIPKLADLLRDQVAGLTLSEAQAFELVLQHDELRYCLSHGEYHQGRQVAEKLLREFPDFIPALNNLAQIEAVEGNLYTAIRISQRVLAIEPENIHALSNLTRLSFLSGHPVEAGAFASRLKDSQADAVDRWTKSAEALTFLGDDAGVLALYERAKAAGQAEPPAVDALFFHLLAVAAFHQGNEQDAQRYWNEAIKINPGFNWALENLADLKKPIDERGGVWAFPFENWLLDGMARELLEEIKKLKQTAKTSEAQEPLGRYLEEHQARILFLAPHLIERGNARARDFVVRTAAVSAHPTLVAAAQGFISSRNGAFKERFEAANILTQANLLPTGLTPMWSNGEMREILLMNVEITAEPEASKMPKRVQTLFDQAWHALHDRDGVRAQALLEQALVLWPDDPSLINNLAAALDIQGHSQESARMLRDLHTRFPEYFFGVITVASMEAIAGNLDRAHEMLDGLMQRKKLHTSEFTALCRAQIQVALAEHNREAAHQWIELWERVDPEHPELIHYRRRAGMTGKR